MRIISLVPSITELLIDLGLKDELMGRTKFCIHPMPTVKDIPTFGGTKNVDINKILAAKPDLIIANKEENLKAQIEVLQKSIPVLVTDVSSLEENNAMIQEIGLLTHTVAKANEIILEIKTEFEKLTPIKQEHSALYLIWKNPLMSIGSDTFIHSMLGFAGFKNVCAHLKRYPEVNIEDAFNPAWVLLSSEPYPFKEKHLQEFQDKFPKAKMVLVDGEMFSWYGSRIRWAPQYFLQLRKKLDMF